MRTWALAVGWHEAATEGVCGWLRVQPEIGPAGHESLKAPPWIQPGNVGICSTEGRRELRQESRPILGAFGRQGGKMGQP